MGRDLLPWLWQALPLQRGAPFGGAVKQQPSQLLGQHLDGRDIVSRCGPARELPAREPIVAQPKTAASVRQNLHRRGATVAKDKHDAAMAAIQNTR